MGRDEGRGLVPADFIGPQAEKAARLATDKWAEGRAPKVLRIAKAKYNHLVRRGLANIGETTDDIALSQVGRDCLQEAQAIGPKSDLYEARTLYIKGLSPREISLQTGIAVAALEDLINDPATGWALQRERVFENISKELAASNLPILKETRKVGIGLIKKSLEFRASMADEKPVTLGESQQIAQILTFISKEVRLDEDTAQDKLSKSLTTQEIFDSIVDDPYLGPAIRKLARNAVPVEVKAEEKPSGEPN